MACRSSMRDRRLLLCLLALVLAVSIPACRRGGQRGYAERMESGQRYLEQGKFAEAAIEFRGAIQQSPQQAEPYYRLGLAYLAMGNLMEAVPALVKAAEIDPRHAGSQKKLAEMLAASKDPKLREEARKRAEQALAAEPKDAEALTVLAMVETRLGDTGTAEKHLLEALRQSPANLRAAAVLASLKLAQGDPQAAEAGLRSVVEAGPPSADARVVLAEFLLATNRPAEAEKELRQALAIDGKHIRAMLALAALQAAGGKLEEVSRIYQQISRQGDPRYRHLYGAFLFSQGKREEALREFEQAARENPSDRQARSRLIAAYVVLNRPDQARRLLAEALAKNPRDVDALLQQSEIDLRAGDLAKAQERLREVLRYKPDSAEAHYLLARAYARQGERRLEREELGQVLNLRPDHLAARLALATSFSESGNPQGALDALELAPPSQRESLEYIVLRSHALLALGRTEEASAQITQALARGSAPDLLALDGEVKLRLKQNAAAQASFESALRQNPAHLGALGGLYRAVAAQRGVSAALDALRRHAANHPKSARVQHYFGERLLANGRRDEAKRAFQAAVEAEPGFSEAEVSLARLDLAAGNLDAARKRLNAALSRGADPIVVHSILAALETQAKNIDAAADHYRKVLEVAPANVNALTNLSYLLGEYLGREDEALNLAQKAKEAEPDNLDATSVVGWIYYRKGIYNTAAQYLKEAVSKQGSATGPTAAFRHCYLGLTYLKLGDVERGAASLRQALAAGPDPKHAEMARAALEQAQKGLRAHAEVAR